MIHPRDVTTEAEAAVLEHADRLAAVIGKHWHPTDDTAPDDVMLLVADLLRAHAETGIEMQTWRAALDVVMDHLAAEPEGGDLLHRLGRPAWFTVIGTAKDGQREPVAVLPGRRLEHTGSGTHRSRRRPSRVTWGPAFSLRRSPCEAPAHPHSLARHLCIVRDAWTLRTTHIERVETLSPPPLSTVGINGFPT